MKIRKPTIEITLESEYERQLFLDILDCARIHREDWFDPKMHGYSFAAQDERGKLAWRELLENLLEI